MIDFIIMSLDGSEVFIPPFETIRITEEINKGYDGTISVSYPDIKKYAESFGLKPDNIFSSTKREWYLRKNEVKIFGGVLLSRTINGGSNGMTSFSVDMADFSILLDKRRTGALFQRTATDSADIVQDLLDYTNAISDTGISIGNKPTSTKNRNITSRYANIRDEIASMSNLKKYDGYDWDVDVTKKLNIYYPSKGSTNNNIIFDEFNTLSFQSIRQLQGRLTNRVIVFGSGYGDTMVTATRENTTSQSTWGLLEDGLSEKGVEDTSELADRGDQFLNNNAYPIDVISLSHRDDNPDFTSYNIGDTVRITFDEIGVNTPLRIYKRTIQINSSGSVIISLSFEQ